MRFIVESLLAAGDSIRETHAWLHAIKKAGTFYSASKWPTREEIFYVPAWFISFLRYNISFIDPPLGGFGEILPEVMIFPSGFVPPLPPGTGCTKGG